MACLWFSTETVWGGGLCWRLWSPRVLYFQCSWRKTALAHLGISGRLMRTYRLFLHTNKASLVVSVVLNKTYWFHTEHKNEKRTRDSAGTRRWFISSNTDYTILQSCIHQDTVQCHGLIRLIHKFCSPLYTPCPIRAFIFHFHPFMQPLPSTTRGGVCGCVAVWNSPREMKRKNRLCGKQGSEVEEGTLEGS